MFTSIVRLRLIRTQLKVCAAFALFVADQSSAIECWVVLSCLYVLFQQVQLYVCPVDTGSLQYKIACMSDGDLIASVELSYQEDIVFLEAA